jgi:hypothetical protein
LGGDERWRKRDGRGRKGQTERQQKKKTKKKKKKKKKRGAMAQMKDGM